MREPVGIILAGGRGTRMGGVPKGDLTLAGRRLLDLSADRLEPQVGAIAVNSNDPIAASFPVIADTVNGHLGPLAGVLAGLGWARSHDHTHVVTVAVDTPFFPCDLVPQLLMAGNGTLAIAATSDGEHGTFGLWPTTLHDPLMAFLEGGGRKVRAFTEAHNATIAMFPDTTPAPFFNINTPDDLAQAAAWM
ncbi:molybdenum cofactor guanylyltransferase [Octadecabacter sp. G9-8]|uniref:Molybdenum cofactor guanylyltransferase n=1 Tax=Octadecabacter dasysiphoniae TaxID=2909341 RepID=A0ABS9CVD4_9RHOB|nr:molybdenum cofactor guanylyltransferase MobA [Octadecabacter dasysiphoniae]MCF2871212.1 molybdenum cofactor guanylyltransferase [Octadecabacter dasysiphoniae]